MLLKRSLKKWGSRILLAALFIVGILLAIILNPVLTYANNSRHKQFTIFHNNTFDPALTVRLEEALVLAARSEMFKPELKLDICLNDGSRYPRLIERFLGDGYAHGFYDKVVLNGHADFSNNFVELNGFKWNATQLLAHEMIHCYQFSKMGLWKSNPVAGIPVWKWEGYPEYVARQYGDQVDLRNNITRLMNQPDQDRWILFEDKTGTVASYYRFWLMVQFCMNIKKMSYAQILRDQTPEAEIWDQMMKWYQGNPR